MVGGFISKTTRQPGLALDDDETTLIAKSAENVARFYDVPISPVQQAWCGLAMTVGAIYAAKISAIKLMKAAEKTPANVSE